MRCGPRARRSQAQKAPPRRSGGAEAVATGNNDWRPTNNDENLRAALCVATPTIRVCCAAFGSSRDTRKIGGTPMRAFIGQQRYLCKDRGLSFTNTPARGKPLALKAAAVLLYISGGAPGRVGVRAKKHQRNGSPLLGHTDYSCPSRLV